MAGGKLDQQNPFEHDTATFGAGITMTATDGQTFTAGKTGALDRVAVYLEHDLVEPLPPGKIFLDIYPTDGAGLPRTDRSALGSGSVPTSAAARPEGFVTIPLSHPAAVKKGTVYAIVLRSDVDIEFSVAWDGSTGPDLYPRGGEAERADVSAPWEVFPRQDHFFKTFVTEPRKHHRHHR
ncbi:MAG TPA: hypothetical protein VFI22_03795 [Thermomicrobiales bacterium]|nr:hypothetical protein [Thermomicrobiales bacterium]